MAQKKKRAAVEQIIRIVKENNSCKVLNASYLPVQTDDDVTLCDAIIFRAVNTQAYVFIPEEEIFGKQTIDLVKKDEESIKIKKNAPKGVHYFAVWCKDIGKFGEANSHPSIIIED